MTDEEDQTPKWMKRLKWAHTGLPLVDERVNAVASLWAEGEVFTVELGRQVQEIRMSLGYGKPSTEKSFEFYSSSALTACQWSAFLHTVHFCEVNLIAGQDRRVEALKLFEKELSGSDMTGSSSSRSWIAEACARLSNGEDAEGPMGDMFHRWVAGELTSNKDLHTQGMAVQEEMHKLRIPNPDAPETAIKPWFETLRAKVQSILIQETNGYCEAAGLHTPEERMQAWNRMIDELQLPPPPTRSR